MKGDGKCDAACMVSECNFDNIDCGCSPGCYYQEYAEEGFDYCSDECMSLSCTQYEPVIQCSDNDKKIRNYYYQIVNQQYTYLPLDKECIESDDTCSYDIINAAMKGTCPGEGECISYKCAYLQQYCNQSEDCDLDCSLCNEAGECLECEEGTYQSFTECKSYCDWGYDALSLSFMPQQICIPFSAFDNYSEERPKELFVSNLGRADGKGTIDDPFNSLSYAILSIGTKHTKILLATGHYDLEYIETFKGKPVQYPNSPLSNHQILGSLTITTASCDNYDTFIGCSNFERAVIQPTTRVTLSFNAKIFRIEDIDFDGSKLVCTIYSEEDPNCNCSIEACRYFPMLITDEYYIDYHEVTMLNDRYEIIPPDEPMARRSEAHNGQFIFCVDHTRNYLKNIEFREFRFRSNSFMYFTNCEVELYNVDFIRMASGSRSDNAVIYHQNNFMYKYAFKYDTGNIMYINDGYELISETSLGGFLLTDQVKKVTLKNLKFSYNLTHLGTRLDEPNDYFGVLIVIKDHKYLAYLENITFEYNYTYKALLFITGLRLKFSRYDILENIVNSETIQIRNLTVSHCSSKVYLIYYESGIYLHRIYIENFSMTNNISLTEALIYFWNSDSLADSVVYGGEFDLVNGQNRKIYVPRRYIIIKNFYAENNYVEETLLQLNRMVNAEFTNINVINNIDKLPDLDTSIVNHITLDYFKDKQLYIRDGFQEEFEIACYSIIDLFYVYNFSWDSGSYSGNTCTLFGPDTYYGNLALYVDQSDGDMILNNVKFHDIHGAARYSNLFNVVNHGPGLMKVTNCEFKNISEGAAGVIYLQNVEAVEISNCKFENVSGNDYGAIVLMSGLISVHNNEFYNVKSTIGSGAGLRILASGSGELSINIEENMFERCLIPQGNGCITLENNGLVALIYINLNSLTFRFCEGQSSAIHIAPSLMLKSSSISNIIVEGNKSTRNGPFYIQHKEGLLQIKDSIFKNNTGLKCGIEGVFIEEGELLNIENVEFIDNMCNTGLILVVSASDSSITRTQNIKCENNSSVCASYSFGTFYDTNSIYRGNRVGILLITGAIGIFDSADISYNTNPTGTSGAYVLNKSTLRCSNCIFSNNQGRDGTVIRSEQDSEFHISSTTIEGNISYKSSSAIYIIGSSFNSTLTNTSIIDNISNIDFFISSQSGNLIMINCLISNNTAYTNPSILIYNSYIYINNCIFKDQTLDAISLLYFSSDGIGVIEDSKFFNIHSERDAGAITTIRSRVTIKNSLFENISNRMGGTGIKAISFSGLEMTNVSFYNMRSEATGSLIYATDSSIRLNNIEAKDFSMTGLYIYNPDKFELRNSTFSNGLGVDGGVLQCSECYDIAIYSSNFTNNTATSFGGAIYINLEIYEPSNIIYDSIFSDNKASSGGAIYATDTSIDIKNSYFYNNQVEYDGGALELICTMDNLCYYNITNSYFYNNQASGQGGAIYWDYRKPNLINTTFESNSASYGEDMASYPIMIQYLEDGKPVSYQRKLQSSSYSPIAYSISDAVPGQKLPYSLNLALIDHFGNIVYSDSTSSGEISEVDGTTVLSGSKKVIAVAGELIFKDLSIQYIPGQTTYLQVYSSGINDKKQFESGDDNESYSTVYIEVSFRNCIPGEYDLGRECKVCDSGTYSLSPDNPCEECPNSASCLGGFEIYPKSGYWRTDKYTDMFYDCFNPDACLGSSNYTSYTGICSEGYLGNLCQACDSGYSRTSENQCGACPDETVNAVRLVGILILVIIICVIMVKSTFKSAYVPSSVHSIYIKIFTNYLQLVMITTQFKLAWPDPVLELFSIQKQSGTITDQIFSVDCYLSDGSSEAYKDVYFQKIIVLALVPLILFFFSFVFWGILAQKTLNRTYLRKEMIATDVILFFLVHPNITQASFAVFSCMYIDGKGYYLLDNLDIECWNGKHYLYSMSLALPCIIVWVLGAPAVVLYYMYKHKNELQEIDNKLRFGFLYNGYKSKTFYWEFVILYRKILIICISVFFTTISINIQALAAILVFLLSLYMQMRTQPFTLKILNIMEARGILAATATIYCGLFYLTNHLDDSTKLFFFAVIVSVNFYFLSYWLYHFCMNAWIMVRNKVGYFRRKFDHEDGYEFDILTTDPLASQVIQIWGQNKCTLLKHDRFDESEHHKVPDSMYSLYKHYIKIEQNSEISASDIADQNSDRNSYELDIAGSLDNSSDGVISLCIPRCADFNSDEDEEILEEKEDYLITIN